MGLIRANMYPLLMEHARHPLSGDLLFLGFPDVYFSASTFRDMARAVGVQIASDVGSDAIGNPLMADKGYTSAREIFGALGVSAIRSLDVSSFESADIIYDLNASELPSHLANSFDCIIDHGTIEHVFHTPNCMMNLWGILKEGGRIIHSSPANNMMDHGFYQFSPTFFRDFYSANNWTIDTHLVCQFTREQETEPPFFSIYEPAPFARLSYGGLDSKLYSNFFVATKLVNSTGHVIPQQGYYASRPTW